MASKSRTKTGGWVVQVVVRGRRRTLRVGRVSEARAEKFRLKIADLADSLKLGIEPEVETRTWVGRLEDELADRLVHAGLIPTRGPIEKQPAPEDITLGEFLKSYFAARTEVKESTTINWGHTKRCLLAFFGADRTLASITPGDARDFERYLKTTAREHRYAGKEIDEGLSGPTVSKRISNAKQFFADAVDRELILKNPFGKLKGGVKSNRSRDRFITLAEAKKVLDACPDAEWRLLFALSRFGGLRCPSEHLALTWGDVDFGAGRMTVRSPKTEHHEGKAERLVPLFSELRPYLEDAYQLASDGGPVAPDQPVIGRSRDVTINLRTHMKRIIRKAGLTPWPKLFQNLRSTRETELAETFPLHVVCAWIGNSQAVAKKHYLQTTDEHFQAAASRSSALQNALHSEEELEVTERKMETIDLGEPAIFPCITAYSLSDLENRRKSMGRRGLEPLTSTV